MLVQPPRIFTYHNTHRNTLTASIDHIDHVRSRELSLFSLSSPTQSRTQPLVCPYCACSTSMHSKKLEVAPARPRYTNQRQPCPQDPRVTSYMYVPVFHWSARASQSAMWSFVRFVVKFWNKGECLDGLALRNHEKMGVSEMLFTHWKGG